MDEEMDPLEAQERALLELIHMNRIAYEKAIEPYVKQLVRLRSMRTGPIFIDPSVLVAAPRAVQSD